MEYIYRRPKFMITCFYAVYGLLTVGSNVPPISPMLTLHRVGYQHLALFLANVKFHSLDCPGDT